MKIEQQHIDQIREAFGKMQSKDDFLDLLNYAKPLVYGEKAVPFKLSQLNWYINPRINQKRYREFTIKKKSGADRIIHSPVEGLLSIQKTLSFILQCVFDPHNASYGFVRGRSIVDNAKVHAGSKYVYNIDLKDFFPSIDQARVWKCFQLSPFNLIDAKADKLKFVSWDEYKSQNLGIHEPINFVKKVFDGRFRGRTDLGRITIPLSTDIHQKMFVLVDQLNPTPINKIKLVNRNKTQGRRVIANMMAALCCHEMQVERKNSDGQWEHIKLNVLPQGAPTSPVITNIICQRLDHLLSGVAKRFGLKYSRYADDITFSSNHNVYQAKSDFLIELQRIIENQGFHIKESKTRLQKEGYRQEVTGLLVNEKVNVQKRYIKQLRMWLYYWERYGYERANTFFLQKYSTNSQQFEGHKPELMKVLDGKLNYLKMISYTDGQLYLKLSARFHNLTQRAQDVGERSEHLNDVLNTLLDKGVDQAMELFNVRRK